MAALSKHGAELFRGLDKRRGALVALMSDGTTLQRRIGEGWKRRGQVKAGYTPAEVAARWRLSDAFDPTIRHLPTPRELEEWVSDSVCETPCGCTVEPDGHCPHSKPSWLLLLGMV